MVQYLHRHKIENVGVLKFEVKDGSAAPSMHAGLLNGKIAEELEVALTMSVPDDVPLGVIHNATAAAFKQDPHAGCETPAERRKLFDRDYPLAWGKESVKAGAFLTGRVSLGLDKDGKSDPKSTLVEVRAFDKTGDVIKTWNLEVKTDRVLLADSGKGFKLSKKPLGGKDLGLAPAEEADIRALDGGAGVEAYPVSLKILYDGKEQGLSADAGAGKLNCFRIAPPQVGQSVSLVVKNEGDKKVGVVLCVNGLNTLYQEPEGCPADMHKWVLEKGQEYLIEGFEGEDHKSVYPFEVVSPDAAKVADEPFADSELIGLITMHVLPEGDASEPAEVLTGKGLRFPRHAANASAADVKKALADYAQEKSKDLISKSRTPKPDEIGFNPLNNPILKETRVIRYADPTP